MCDDKKLETFLEDAGLVHLMPSMLEEGMTIEVLLEANDTELALLTSKVADKIKLRAAVEKIRQKNCPLLDRPVSPCPVAPLQRQNATLNYFMPENSELQNLTSASPSATSTGTAPEQNVPEKSLGSKELSFLLDLDFNLLSEEKELEDKEPQGNLLLQSTGKENCTGENLRHLLLKETTGQCLLKKTENGLELNSRDRAYIVKVVVEAELKRLEKLNHTIRRDVWLQWANEISQLFKGEPQNLYYVPYHVVDTQVVQASGLIHNRLITHRRTLSSETRKRRNSASSDSGRSSKSSHSDKRVRPLPNEYQNSLNEENSESQQEHQLEWLKGSSCPYDTVLTKWRSTFELRTKLLRVVTYQEYFNTFPALKLPNGYQLLATDFQCVYPAANKTYEERFPLIKLKLLKLLAERGESSKADLSTIDLLDLASVGEEQANVAALLGIVTLLRQMPTICVPKKKVWKLSREEARNGFLARVATASDIETYCIQREMLFVTKGIPNQPFILAVGPSWANVSQYEIVIHKGLRYQIDNICSAVMYTYNLYCALDCAYPRDSAQCWMLIQKTMFQMSSKYDVEGVPLRELLKQLEVPTK